MVALHLIDIYHISPHGSSGVDWCRNWLLFELEGFQFATFFMARDYGICDDLCYKVTATTATYPHNNEPRVLAAILPTIGPSISAVIRLQCGDKLLNYWTLFRQIL